MGNALQPDTLSLADQNRLLSQEIQHKVQQLAAINAVAAVVSQSLDLDTTLNKALDAVLNVFPLEAAGISLVDDAAGELVLRAQRGWKHDFVKERMTVALGEGLSGRVVTEDRPIVTGRVEDEPLLAVPAFAREQINAQVLAPMHAQGKVIGVLSVMSREVYNFSKSDINVLCAIADQVGIALDNASLYAMARSQESRLRAIISSAGDAILVTDINGCISLVNPAAEQLLNLPSNGALVGEYLFETAIPDCLRKEIQQTMQRGAASPALFDVALPSGVTLTGVISPLRDPVSAVPDQGWVIILRDVSHIKAAEESRIEFVQTAAHDLRNPLGVILSGLMMLKDYLPLQDASAAEIFDITLDANHRMQNLLDDLLNLEHIESRSGFHKLKVNPRPLLVEAFKEMQPSIQNNHQTCQLELPNRLPQVELDVDWFQRALMNYLSNATKYTPEGGHIVMRAYVRDGELCIEVEDNGAGIPQEAQGHLFERFYRTGAQQHSKIKGSGLGLAIVRSVVEAHAGRVYVHSQPGRGSLFGMALPIP
jgi:PAS domain S-box-containing protein